MVLKITVTLETPTADWYAEDPARANLIAEGVEAQALDAAVEASGWEGRVSSFYIEPTERGAAARPV